MKRRNYLTIGLTTKAEKEKLFPGRRGQGGMVKLLLDVKFKVTDFLSYYDTLWIISLFVDEVQESKLRS